MKRLTIIFIGIMVLMTGCVNYTLSSSKKAIYTEAISDEVFTVTFCGNAYMSRDEVEKYTMQRACELTLTKGFTHFVTLQKTDESELCMLTGAPPEAYSARKEDVPTERVSDDITQKSVLVRPNLTLRIKCFSGKDAPEAAVDAQRYLNDNFPGLKF